MSQEEKYNGWTNWETWDVALWINNDQGMQEAAIDLLKQDYEYNFQRDEALRDWFTELVDEGVIKDHISLHRVNWTEIVESFRENFEDDDDEDEDEEDDE